MQPKKRRKSSHTLHDSYLSSTKASKAHKLNKSPKQIIVMQIVYPNIIVPGCFNDLSVLTCTKVNKNPIIDPKVNRTIAKITKKYWP